MGIAFVNGVIRRGRDLPDSDRLYVSDGEVREWPAELGGAAVVDLEGGFLGAAFSDGHAHPLHAGREGDGPQIRHLRTPQEIAALVGDWAAAHPEREWIVGGSYDATIVPDGVFDARWLDELIPDRPVVLRSWDYHTVWCNSRALELAGIDAEKPDPPFGRIGRREDGTPSGMLLESAAQLVLNAAPPADREDLVGALRRSTARLASYGIAWVHEAWTEEDEVEAWIAAAAAGALAVDVGLALRADPERWPDQLGRLVALRERIAGSPHLTGNTVKFFVDGILENHTAVLLAPYADDCSHGLPNWSPKELADAVLLADAEGFDLHLHAIGDGAVRSALDAVERLTAERPRPSRRITVAHAQLIDPADLERFGRLGVTVCFQPLWAAPDAVMVGLTMPRIGVARELQYRMRSVLDSGANISFGSDWPVTTPDVLAGVRTAVTRQDENGLPTAGWFPEERLTVDQALDAATLGVAEQRGQAAVAGHLAVGARADLVWLSDDPRRVAPLDLARVAVRGTWRAGVRTYAP